MWINFLFLNKIVLVQLMLLMISKDSLAETNSIEDSTSPINLTNFEYVPRSGWNAREPKAIETFSKPASYVIIHHSYTPQACYTDKTCIAAMQSMQHFHMDTHGWNDIGYSFAIGGNGKIYVGRNFQVIAAHAPGYNDKSVGICLIGDWRTEEPSQEMLHAANRLIEFGIQQGHLRADYELMGHRQVRDTECPGDALFNVVKKWPHWSDAEPIFRPGYKRNSTQ